MEVRPGYKQTEVGVIPEGWRDVLLDRIAERGSGHTPDKKHPEYWNGSIKWISLADSAALDRGFIDDTISTITPEGIAHSSAVLHPAGTVVLSRDAGVGKSAIMRTEMAVSQHFMAWQCGPDLDNLFLYYWLQAAKPRFERIANGTTIKTIGLPYFKDLKIPHPPLPEQRAIAAALSDVDALLGGLDRLIAKKRDLKEAAMHQLLTGRTRLPGFDGGWEVKRIADVASPSSERNATGETLPVLTCSKHFGFMDSLSFFKNQVFSNDLTTYKLIRRDEIGYPGNHVEEGSIGLQDLYDSALVSPIYVVFSVTEAVSSYFLHRLLKLDSYRQRFRTATASSVDRRGSLRWPAFSEITVRLPPTKTEQTAIATVLSDMERELAALEARRNKTRHLKQAMMQALLTGKTRLVPVGGDHA